MSEYYGVTTPTDDFLAHYGIKGMKWGVRRALKNNNIKALSDHYQKAILKETKLKNQTNRQEQKDDAKAYAAGGGALLGLGALSGLAGYGIAKGQVAAQKALFPNSKSHLIMHPVGLYGMAGASALGGLASLGASAKSAYRATKHGNKRAIQKYDQFKSEMNKTFPKYVKKNIQKHWKKHPEDRWIDT